MEKLLGVINESVDKEYMTNLLTYNIAPVIAGFKPSSLINISNKYKNMYDLWSSYGEEYIKNINLKVFELKREEKGKTLLFYNKDILENTLRNSENRKFLSKYGYNKRESLEGFLNTLKARYAIKSCPHEIGIFLGIPVEDVKEFINCRGKNCVYCGYWKVYSNIAAAIEIFDTYDRSKEYVIDLLSKKTDLKQISNMLPSKFKETLFDERKDESATIVNCEL